MRCDIKARAEDMYVFYQRLPACLKNAENRVKFSIVHSLLSRPCRR